VLKAAGALAWGLLTRQIIKTGPGSILPDQDGAGPLGEKE